MLVQATPTRSALYAHPLKSASLSGFPPKAPAVPLHVPVCNRFGMRLRTLRKERNYTQEQMSRRFGIDRSYISEIERGTKSISLSLLEVFAVGFRMSLAELLSDL